MRRRGCRAAVVAGSSGIEQLQDRAEPQPRRYLKGFTRYDYRHGFVLLFLISWAVVLVWKPGNVIRIESTAPVHAGDTAEPGVPDAGSMSLYATALRLALEKSRPRVVERLRDQIGGRRDQQIAVLMVTLFFMSLAGLFLIFAPLVLFRRFPGRTLDLVRYSALAAALYLVVAFTFLGFYAVTRMVHARVSTASNPEIAVTESLFDFLIQRADTLVEIGPAIVEPSLDTMRNDPSAPPLSVVLQNAGSFDNAVRGFRSLAGLARVVSTVLSFVPWILLVVTFAAYVRNLLPTLLDIVRLPSRGARHEPRLARTTTWRVVGTLAREAVYTAGIVGILAALIAILGLLGRRAIDPALEVALNDTLAALSYIQVEPGAHPALVFVNVASAIMFIGVALATSAACAALFLWKSGSVLRYMTRHDWRRKELLRFWLLGSAAALWVMAIPILYAQLASPVVAAVGRQSITASAWEVYFGLISVLFIIVFIAVFWAAHGFTALRFILRFNPSPEPATTEQRLATSAA